MMKCATASDGKGHAAPILCCSRFLRRLQSLPSMTVRRRLRASASHRSCRQPFRSRPCRRRRPVLRPRRPRLRFARRRSRSCRRRYRTFSQPWSRNRSYHRRASHNRLRPRLSCRPPSHPLPRLRRPAALTRVARLAGAPAGRVEAFRRRPSRRQTSAPAEIRRRNCPSRNSQTYPPSRPRAVSRRA